MVKLTQITKNKEEKSIINKGLLVNIGNTGSVLLSAPPNMTYGVMIMEMEVHSNNELYYTAGNWFAGLLVIQYDRQRGLPFIKIAVTLELVMQF